MVKRRRDSADDVAPDITVPRSLKRPRLNHPDRLSRLSDELILRILSHLDVPNLITCQRLSRRFGALATDSQLWKALYYTHFVRPRASRIPGVLRGSLVYSSKVSKWLDEQYLVQPGTNWKGQYKLRYNWTNGSSRVSELELSGHLPPIPPLIRMRKDFAVTADAAHGLRVWKIQGAGRLLTTHSLRSDRSAAPDKPCIPSSIAVDDSSKKGEMLEVAVGFQDGGFAIYGLSSDEGNLRRFYRHPSSSNGTISAVAFNYPYLGTVSEKQLLSLYSLSHRLGPDDPNCEPPRLICSLRSHTARSPLSVSLRILSSGIVASIAYVLPSYITGWTVGLQEVRFSLAGKMTDSRIASTTLPGYQPLVSALGSASCANDDTDEDTLAGSAFLSLAHGPVPTSLSYAHPYLLVAHPDNTLTVYLVRSTDATLRISRGRQLWGHTSSVSDAQVGDRGRAISASRSGDEIRVWELEGIVPPPHRPAVLGDATSVAVRRQRPTAAMEALQASVAALPRDHRVVGFDQEKVVTMREDGERTLVVYDFS